MIFYETMLNNPQGGTSFSEGYGGEVILISVNAIGSDEDLKGHRVQLFDRVDGTSPATTGYPDGFMGF